MLKSTAATSRSIRKLSLCLLVLVTLSGASLVRTLNVQELEAWVPYDSLDIIKLNLGVEVFQRDNEPPEKLYYEYVGMGEPRKTTRALFDTTTTEVWIPRWTWNPFARNLKYDMGHRCSESVTCTGPSGSDYKLDYRGTTLSGEAFSDQLSIGTDMINYHYDSKGLLPMQTKTGKITIKQRFLGIYSASDNRHKRDGIYTYLVVGLAPATHSLVSNSTPVLMNMQKSMGSNSNGFIEKRAFGTMINRELFSLWMKPLDLRAELLFGAIDKRKYNGSIHYHPLSSSAKLWQVSGSQIWLGRRLLSKPQGYSITIDTVINDLYGPREIVEELYKELNATRYEGTNIYLVNCDTAPNLPELSFQFSEDASLNLAPKYYIRTMNLATNSFTLLKETCYVSVKPHDTVNDWTLGTHFLEAYYTVFDQANRRIGFASSIDIA